MGKVTIETGLGKVTGTEEKGIRVFSGNRLYAESVAESVIALSFSIQRTKS